MPSKLSPFFFTMSIICTWYINKCLGLDIVQLLVLPVLLNQFTMSTRFDQFAFFHASTKSMNRAIHSQVLLHSQNKVGVLGEMPEAMGYENHRLPFPHKS